MRIELAQLVKAPREQVFQAWTDCEAWPTWDPVVFTRVRVTERVGNTVRIDAEVKFMGMRMPRKERHILTPPEKIEVIGDVPNAANKRLDIRGCPGGDFIDCGARYRVQGIAQALAAHRRMAGANRTA